MYNEMSFGAILLRNQTQRVVLARQMSFFHLQLLFTLNYTSSAR